MNDTHKALIACGVFIYILGMFTMLAFYHSIGKGCEVTFTHKDHVSVLVGSWK